MIAPENERDRGGQDLATSTLAEIYAQQGLLERARAIYERIAHRSPGDPRIAERIETLTRAIRDRNRAPMPEPEAPRGGHEPAATGGDRPLVDGAVGEDRPPQETRTTDEEAQDDVFETWLESR